VLSDVEHRLRADCDRHHAQITSDPLPTLNADPILIGELLQNLIENSMKYRSAAPLTIHVSAIRQSKAWVFSVRDNGVGIRAEECDKVFAPFYQLRAGQSATCGVGLGLATCKQIVERHGGGIWVRSNVGEGATFSFSIPECPTTQKPPTVPLHTAEVAGCCGGGPR
jgi:signal transduction histidine kinase